MADSDKVRVRLANNRHYVSGKIVHRGPREVVEMDRRQYENDPKIGTLVDAEGVEVKEPASIEPETAAEKLDRQSAPPEVEEPTRGRRR